MNSYWALEFFPLDYSAAGLITYIQNLILMIKLINNKAFCSSVSKPTRDYDFTLLPLEAHTHFQKFYLDYPNRAN